MRLWVKLLDLLYPPKCVFCGRLLREHGVFACENCKKKLPYTRGADVKKNGEFFDYCLVPLHYRDSVRESILAFKFRDRPGRAENYAVLLADCIRDNLGDDFDIITWVPISKKRKARRGYDQSELIAKATAKLLGMTAVSTLNKHTDIPAQSSLKDKAKRKANVSDVYEAVDSANIAGKRILLVDDIITTGATMGEGSRTLLMAGAEKVVGACVATAD